MATAKIRKVWYDEDTVYLQVEMSEEGVTLVQYTGSVPRASLEGLTNAQKKAALVAAVKAVRRRQRAGIYVLPITGTVEV